MGSSYEVYIDVRHHPRHLDEWEQRESTAFKLVDNKEPLEHVADALRTFANQIDPRFVCLECGKTRGEHHHEAGLDRCFNKYGPIAGWWERPRSWESYD